MSLPSTTSHQALNITEILETIGQYLDQDDLFRCIQVSKLWSLTLKPLLFQDIRISYNISNHGGVASVFAPSNEDTQTNSTRAQRLTIINCPMHGGKIEVFRACQFSQLEHFTWISSLTHRGVDENNWNSMIKFIKANNTKIRSITIGVIYRSSLTEFYKVLALNCTHTLRHLCVQNINFSMRSLSWFWVACRSLESLELRDIHIPPIRMDQSCSNIQVVASHVDKALQMDDQQAANDEMPSSPIISEINQVVNILKLPNMRRLTISGIDSIDSQMTLIKSCPGLESIDWDAEIEVDTPAFGLLNTMISHKNYQSLHSVTLRRLFISDDDMERIFFDLDKSGQRDSGVMESFRLLKTLQIPKTCFGQKSLMEMKRCGHCNTIQYLDLRSSDIGSRDILEILTSCPNLISLIAPKLHAADIVKNGNKPWVCLGLQKWEVCIETSLLDWISPFFLSDELAVCPARSDPATTRERLYNVGPPSEQEMQEASLEQLGRLHQLRSLKIISNGVISNPRKGINLELTQGLDLLKNLSKLEELSFMGSCLREEEVKWMFLHWEKLKGVSFWENTLESNSNRILRWLNWSKVHMQQ